MTWPVYSCREFDTNFLGSMISLNLTDNVNFVRILYNLSFNRLTIQTYTQIFISSLRNFGNYFSVISKWTDKSILWSYIQWKWFQIHAKYLYLENLQWMVFPKKLQRNI